MDTACFPANPFRWRRVLQCIYRSEKSLLRLKWNQVRFSYNLSEAMSFFLFFFFNAFLLSWFVQLCKATQKIRQLLFVTFFIIYMIHSSHWLRYCYNISVLFETRCAINKVRYMRHHLDVHQEKCTVYSAWILRIISQPYLYRKRKGKKIIRYPFNSHCVSLAGTRAPFLLLFL